MSFWRQAVGLNCDALVNGNAGCSVSFPTNQSYGLPLNDEGGGWYVMYNKRFQWCCQSIFTRFAVERTDSNINVWFWSRCSLFVPYEVKEGLSSVDPLTWVCQLYLYLSLISIRLYTILQGFPAANFPSTSCNMTSHFSEENIIINLTLCKPSSSCFSVL